MEDGLKEKGSSMQLLPVLEDAAVDFVALPVGSLASCVAVESGFDDFVVDWRVEASGASG